METSHRVFNLGDHNFIIRLVKTGQWYLTHLQLRQVPVLELHLKDLCPKPKIPRAELEYRITRLVAMLELCHADAV